MCGIVGCVARRDVTGILLDGLGRLEYRGYDSVGVAVQNGRGIGVRKQAGRLDGLRDLVEVEPIHGTCGIGHTRWATHGAPTHTNAHPHTDCSGRTAVVHNGIIENADALRRHLQATGHRFLSDTDTEVLAHLIEEAPGATLEERVTQSLHRAEGTYGLAVISEDDQQKIVVARRGSPVMLGLGQGEYFVASDASAVLSHTRSVIYLNDGDTAVVTPDGYRIMDRGAHDITRSIDDIEWDADDIALGGFEHYMEKEIHEQPTTIRNVLCGRLPRGHGDVRVNGLNLTRKDCAGVRRIVIVACGSSWHAALVGRHYIEELAGIPVEVEYASEFRYRTHVPVPGTLTVAISQSGETADTLEAMRAARSAGHRVVGIVNVVGSTIARESDGGIYLHAGPEIGVASTKAFTAQLVALQLFALHLGRGRGLSVDRLRDQCAALEQLPELVERTLEREPEVRAIAEACADARNALYLGRGMHFPVALEGALKLKEISYIHAEGYPAAEMKHGPLALIDGNMPVVVIAPRDPVYAKVVSTVEEVRARGGMIIAITTEGNGDLSGRVAHQIRIPDGHPHQVPVLASIPLQLLAYHMAVLRGCDVDRPRNLAKSVTVE